MSRIVMGLAAVGWWRRGIVVVVVVEDLSVTGVPAEAWSLHPAMSTQQAMATTAPRASRVEIAALSERRSGMSWKLAAPRRLDRAVVPGGLRASAFTSPSSPGRAARAGSRRRSQEARRRKE